MTLTIIGAGPGGYETATAAAAKGIEVNIISDGPVGGTCLNEGCIPTKSLCRNAEVIEDMRKASAFGVSFEGQTGENPEVKFDMAKAVERKDEVLAQLRGGIEFLLKNKLIHLYIGKASFVDAHTVKVTSPEGEETTVSSDYIMIATGSVTASLPIPGNDAEGVLTSREILSLKEVPKRLCVIGAGVIGLEFASIFRSFGSEVSVLEYCKDILPRFDTDMAKRLKQSLGKRGIAIETSAQVQSISRNGEELTVKYIKKDITREQIYNAVGLLKKHKVPVKLNILIGTSPLETKESLRDTLRQARKIGADQIMFNIVSPFPGTEFYNLAKENGWIVTGDYVPTDVQRSSIVSFPNLSNRDMEKILFKANLRYFLSPSFVWKQLRRFHDLNEFFCALKALRIKLFG